MVHDAFRRKQAAWVPVGHKTSILLKNIFLVQPGLSRVLYSKGWCCQANREMDLVALGSDFKELEGWYLLTHYWGIVLTYYWHTYIETLNFDSWYLCPIQYLPKCHIYSLRCLQLWCPGPSAQKAQESQRVFWNTWLRPRDRRFKTGQDGWGSTNQMTPRTVICCSAISSAKFWGDRVIGGVKRRNPAMVKQDIIYIYYIIMYIYAIYIYIFICI